METGGPDPESDCRLGAPGAGVRAGPHLLRQVVDDSGQGLRDEPGVAGQSLGVDPRP